MDPQELELEVQSQLLGFNDMEDESELEGLGRIFRMPMTPQNKNFARAYAKRQVVKQNRSNVLTREQKIFASKVKDLPEQTKKNIANNAATLVDGDRYVRKEISDSTGTTEFFKEVLDKAIGVTNLQDGQLPEGTSMLVSEIAIAVANAVTGDVKVPSYENVFDAAGVPTSILNGEIEITTTSGRTILPPTPMKKFFAVGGAGMVNAESGNVKVKLNAPKMLSHTEKLSITYRGASTGGSYAANKAYLEVRLMGPETANIK